MHQTVLKPEYFFAD